MVTVVKVSFVFWLCGFKVGSPVRLPKLLRLVGPVDLQAVDRVNCRLDVDLIPRPLLPVGSSRAWLEG
jgi:hypothetical protein